MPINNLNSLTPPFLKKGDTIEIIASAKFVNENDINQSVKLIENAGFNVKLNNSLFQKINVFSGTIKERINQLQKALDSTNSEAILFARGGYGFIHLIDQIDFSFFNQHPKWLIGFSDMTTILTHIQVRYNICSIHGPMAYNFNKTHQDSIKKLFSLLRGTLESTKLNGHALNRCGIAQGVIIGGNLSILCSLIGSRSFLDIDNNYILFIEEIDEYVYHIERMIYTLDRAGILKKLKGLIVGSMTHILDNEVPFGKSINQLIYDVVEKYDYPICFNFSIGHNNKNTPIIIGSKIKLDVNHQFSVIEYLK